MLDGRGIAEVCLRKGTAVVEGTHRGCIVRLNEGRKGIHGAAQGSCRLVDRVKEDLTDLGDPVVHLAAHGGCRHGTCSVQVM